MAFLSVDLPQLSDQPHLSNQPYLPDPPHLPYFLTVG